MWPHKDKNISIISYSCLLKLDTTRCTYTSELLYNTSLGYIPKYNTGPRYTPQTTQTVILEYEYYAVGYDTDDDKKETGKQGNITKITTTCHIVILALHAWYD